MGSFNEIVDCISIHYSYLSMFSATQSITPLRDFSESFSAKRIKRPETIEAKPACWSQNVLAGLSSRRFIELTHRYYECQGYTLNNTIEKTGQNISVFHKINDTEQSFYVACSKHQKTIDITDVKNFCDEIKSSPNPKSVFVTRSSFSSGALDFCSSKPVTLISNLDMLSLILKLDAADQAKLLAQATT